MFTAEELTTTKMPQAHVEPVQTGATTPAQNSILSGTQDTLLARRWSSKRVAYLPEGDARASTDWSFWSTGVDL